VLVLEAARRTAGLPIVIVTLLFILYSFFGNYIPGPLYHHGFSLSRIIGLHLTTADGLFAVPLEVTSTFLILFIFFGSALANSGAVDHFLNIANALVGKYNAGPAKLAVVASAFEGTYSGSATANVVGSGSVTIPLMKKLGYDPAFAAAVEASASTGGQIMPPIMGAAAFVMAGMLGIPYFAVVKAALIPAILYFLAVYLVVDLEGRKIGLSPLKDIPSLKDSLINGFHLLIPILLLIYFLLAGYSLMRAGFVLFFSTILLSYFRKDTIVTPRKFFKILECGIRDASSVVMICAVAGLIVGSIVVTGLGLKLGAVILTLAGGHLWLALVFTMCVALVLGMGMPTVAVYIILCTLLGHGLQLLGTPSLLSAHLFMFWFAVISALTPPVAIAAYAGAAIANSDPWKTGYIAFRFAISGFIIPYCFIYGPALLMEGTWPEIIQAIITASLGIFSLSIAVEGWFLTHFKHWAERIIYILAAIFLITPGIITDSLGLVILILGLGLQISRVHKWDVVFAKLKAIATLSK
jgi:TRAP transporter 4TM/12TM fusion protein